MERKKAPGQTFLGPVKFTERASATSVGHFAYNHPRTAGYMHLPYLRPASAVTQVAEQQQAGLTQRQLQLAPG